MKNPFKKLPPIIAMRKPGVNPSEVEKMTKAGYLVVFVDSPDDIKAVAEKPVEEVGDGMGAYLGSGTEKEFEDSKKEDDGTAPWYKRISELV